MNECAICGRGLELFLSDWVIAGAFRRTDKPLWSISKAARLAELSYDITERLLKCSLIMWLRIPNVCGLGTQ